MSTAKSPPPRIPGFTFTESIGGGGFADVFLFSQHSTGRGVAVKVLRAEHLSDRSLRQFEVEANVMAGVSAHPFIVTIHDAGVAPDGRPYLVMEHYPQPHFGRRAVGGRLPLAEVLKVGVQVSSAVETAHRAEILHRDIKPTNILTSAFGDPGLTDFGIAGVQTDGHFDVASGVSLGFTAPEVVFDDGATGSRASDVYGLGATLYSLLTGRSPIYVPGGDNSHAALTVRLEQGAILPTHRDDVPRSLDHLIRSTLDPEPGQRPTTAEGFARALQDIEQQLHLAPTNLVLLDGQVSEHSRPITDDGDGDGTRRRPRIVDIDGGSSAPPAPSRPIRPTPPVATPASLPAVADHTVRRRSEQPPSSVGDTVARARSGPGPESDSVESEAVTPGAPKRSYKVPLTVGASVLVVAILIGLTLNVGGGHEPEEVTTSTRPSTVPAMPVGPASVAPPGRPELTLNQDGSGSLVWESPADLRPSEVASYLVFRSDTADSRPVGEVVSDTALPVPADVFTDDDGIVCFRVRATVVDTSSVSEETCHRLGATGDATPSTAGTP